jgi:small multidrug resistance family-3 protein
MTWILGALGGLCAISIGSSANISAVRLSQNYAANCGIFVVMAVVWGWIFEGVTPDRFDI